MFRILVLESCHAQKVSKYFFLSVAWLTRGEFSNSGRTPLSFFHTINPNRVESSWNQCVHLELHYVPRNMLHHWGHWGENQMAQFSQRDRNAVSIRKVFSGLLSEKITCVGAAGDDVAIDSGYRWLPQQQSRRVRDVDDSQTSRTVQSWRTHTRKTCFFLFTNVSTTRSENSRNRWNPTCGNRAGAGLTLLQTLQGTQRHLVRLSGKHIDQHHLRHAAVRRHDQWASWERQGTNKQTTVPWWQITLLFFLFALPALLCAAAHFKTSGAGDYKGQALEEQLLETKARHTVDSRHVEWDPIH